MDYYKNLELTDIIYFCEIDKIEKTEQWKDIPDYEGLYQVSDLGRVKRMGNNKSKKSKILKSQNIKGYRRLRLSKNNIQNRFFIHRLVCKAFISNKKNKPCVNHKNSIRDCNIISNLEWCTYLENNIHSFFVWLQKEGCNKTFAKLTSLEVIDIRNSKLSKSEMAQKYGVTKNTISSILNRKTWSHL